MTKAFDLPDESGLEVMQAVRIIESVVGNAWAANSAQVTRHRQRQPDGKYRWTQTRAEPGHCVSIDFDELVTDREPRMVAASDTTTEREPIWSARTVESVFASGWAFDAGGRWIYLHPFAQSSFDVTPEQQNALDNQGHSA